MKYIMWTIVAPVLFFNTFLFILPVNAQGEGFFVVDNTGSTHDEFASSEMVYIEGQCPGTADVLVQGYVVADQEWSGGEVLEDVSISTDDVEGDASGQIERLPVWAPPLHEGEYDYVIDVDDDGLYSPDSDCIYGENFTGFSVYFDEDENTILLSDNTPESPAFLHEPGDTTDVSDTPTSSTREQLDDTLNQFKNSSIIRTINSEQGITIFVLALVITAAISWAERRGRDKNKDNNKKS